MLDNSCSGWWPFFLLKIDGENDLDVNNRCLLRVANVIGTDVKVCCWLICGCWSSSSSSWLSSSSSVSSSLRKTDCPIAAAANILYVLKIFVDDNGYGIGLASFCGSKDEVPDELSPWVPIFEFESTSILRQGWWIRFAFVCFVPDEGRTGNISF